MDYVLLISKKKRKRRRKKLEYKSEVDSHLKE
jgi:hypothetical protein